MPAPSMKDELTRHREADFASFGRLREVPVEEMSAEMREAFDFTLALRGLVPGPHRIWLTNPRLSQTIVPTGAYFQTDSTLSKTEIEIVTNIINGRWGAAYANYEHEHIATTLGQLPAETVQRLIAGLPVTFTEPRQQVVYELASALAQARVVPLGLFRRAQELLGDSGIVDVTALMGWFTTVCLTLMAFDVPADAEPFDEHRI